MTNYSNGKIYKIEPLNGEDGDVYIGSTTKEYLSQRMTAHRYNYKKYLEGKCNNVTSFKLFAKYGVDNCNIILLESVNANTKDELHAREAYHIKSVACVNKCIPLQTPKEYREANRDALLIQMKEYYKSNKDARLIQMKLYYDANKDKKKQYQKKQYQNANKDAISEYNKKYQESNKEKITKMKKERYEANKDAINEKRRQAYQNKKQQITVLN